MEDYLIGMGVNIILTLIQASIKNEAKKLKWKKALLKIRDGINALNLEG